MPVILDPESYDTWLHGNAEDAHMLLQPYPAQNMRIVQEGIDLRSDEGAD